MSAIETVNDVMVEDLEFSEALATLQREEEDEDRRQRVNPELEVIKAKLLAQFTGEGQPCLEKLTAIASLQNFREATDARHLNFPRLVANGVSTDLIAQLDSACKQFGSVYNATVTTLQRIPRRIADLTAEDILPCRYREHLNVAGQIAKDIQDGAGNVDETLKRFTSVRRSVVEIAKRRRQPVETFRPDLRPVASERNPTAQVTRDDEDEE